MRVFLPAIEAGVSHHEIAAWLSWPDNDPLTWTLKPGAPRKIVDIFPEYVDFMLGPDRNSARMESDSAAPAEVDYANSSILFVRVWQLARNAHRLLDEAAAADLDKPLVAQLDDHAKDLARLRDQIRDALLDVDDRDAGAGDPHP